MTESSFSGTGTDTPIAPDTTLGVVRLTVSDLERSRRFYEQVIGLIARDGEDDEVVLSAPDGRALTALRGDGSAAALDRRATGLFHQAILLPSRLDLARALVRIAQAGWPLDGASDHLVSEALYLSDPDGNGIEIYRDRPRDQWTRRDGELQMATLTLDLEDVAGELHGERSVPASVPAGTTIGHVHLQVADLAATEAFYHGVLGFDVVVRSYPGALFVSAGGYHHHLGLNTWHSRGGRPAAPGAVGLRSYEVILPSQPELDRVLGQVRSAGLELGADADGSALVRDPNGITVRLLAA